MIQWHPGFVAAMNLEFSKDRQGHMPVCISLTGKEWMRYPISGSVLYRRGWRRRK